MRVQEVKCGGQNSPLILSISPGVHTRANTPALGLGGPKAFPRQLGEKQSCSSFEVLFSKCESLENVEISIFRSLLHLDLI